MKDLCLDIAREYIVRHNHELRTILTSVGRLLPDAGERISFSHLSEAHRENVKAFCGTLEFDVLEVATLPGEPFTKHSIDPTYVRNGFTPRTRTQVEYRCDAARILLQPVFGSNFPASISNCQGSEQAEAFPPRPGEENGRVLELYPTQNPVLPADSVENRGALWGEHWGPRTAPDGRQYHVLVYDWLNERASA